jgi:histidinol-phosphate aminotransferase
MTTHTTIKPQPGILDIAPYVGGASHAAGATRVYKLSSNENPWGPSPKAIEAYEAASKSLAAYPDPGCVALRAAIAERHEIDAERIVCGAGSDELIALLCAAYAGVGDEVVHSRHGFLMYPISAQANGATPVAAAEEKLTASVDNMLAACNEHTKLVFLANPNNPTGTRLNSQEVTRLAAGIPDHALLVLDAAYAECVDGRDGDYDGGAALVDRRDNVVMTRTFSKIYGLAALRLGWLYGPAHVVETLHRIRGPFNVNAAAQAAGVAAMQDHEYTVTCVARNAELRARLVAGLTELGIGVTPSSGNFVLAEFGEGAGGAADADEHLKSRGVIVRRMESYGLPGHLRISVGDDEAMNALLAALQEFRGA